MARCDDLVNYFFYTKGLYLRRTNLHLKSRYVFFTLQLQNVSDTVGRNYTTSFNVTQFF